MRVVVHGAVVRLIPLHNSTRHRTRISVLREYCKLHAENYHQNQYKVHLVVCRKGRAAHWHLDVPLIPCTHLQQVYRTQAYSYIKCERPGVIGMLPVCACTRVCERLTSLCASLRFPCTYMRSKTAMGSFALTSPDAILHSCSRLHVCMYVCY
jgi:hypothetical protein